MSSQNGKSYSLILGHTRERSKQNRSDVEDLDAAQQEIRDRLDTVEAYAKSHAVFLGILGAQALGIPTDQLLSLLLSLL
jgi:hypothetical protein